MDGITASKQDPHKDFGAVSRDLRMSVVLDMGYNRHLVFKPDGIDQSSVEVVTWPGYLQINGSMGSFSFRRLDDMFVFFRGDGNSPANVNPVYWGEKCISHGEGESAVRSYSPDRFRAAVKDDFDNYCDSDELTAQAKGEIWAKIERDVLPYANDAHEAATAVGAFKCNGFDFADFFDRSLEEHNYRFLWCCSAIAHAVFEYDKHKLTAVANICLGAEGLTTDDIANLRGLASQATPLETWRFQSKMGGAMVGGEVKDYVCGSGQPQIAMMMGDQQIENGRLIEATLHSLPMLLDASQRYVDAVSLTAGDEAVLRQRFEGDMRGAVSGGLIDATNGAAWSDELGAYAESVGGLPPTVSTFNAAWLSYKMASARFERVLREDEAVAPAPESPAVSRPATSRMRA